MKKVLPLLFLLAAPLWAKQYPSDISVGVEAGIAAGSLSNHDQGRIFGGRLKIDLTPEWSAAAKLQSRTFKTKDNPSQRTSLQPLFGAAYYNFRTTPLWNPYLFAELGLSHNRSTVFSLDSAKEGTAFGLGAGVELKPSPFNTFGLELAHRRFASASPGGHQVTETAFGVVVNFYIPDDWIPIRPKTPLKIPDMDDPRYNAAPAAPTQETEKRQAQEELDKVQQDIRDRKVPPIHFETGQAVLLSASFETLDIVGTILRRYPGFSVLIMGHTDDVGEVEDNHILSLARAEVVRSYLIQNFGLPADRLAADGSGEEKPIADNTTEEGRFLNRRVEFIIQ